MLCEKTGVMLKTELHSDETSTEPAPSFATDAEIALAQKLRSQLEERYFGSSDPHLPPPTPPDQVH